VLLKNPSVDTLPIVNSPAVRSIAIVGLAANSSVYNPNIPGNGWQVGDYYSGGGSGHVVAANVVTPLEGISARAKKVGITVNVSASDDVEAALAAVAKADLTIVVGATTCGESEDR
jgi:hypothetical protein